MNDREMKDFECYILLLLIEILISKSMEDTKLRVYSYVVIQIRIDGSIFIIVWSYENCGNE